jgi:hypothetical protein
VWARRLLILATGCLPATALVPNYPGVNDNIEKAQIKLKATQ